MGLNRNILRGVLGLVTGFLMASSASAAQQIDLIDRFQNAIESVQEGIDALWPEDLKPEDFSFRLGLGTGFVPDYVGSDDYRLRFLPIVEVRYKDVWRLYGTKFTYTAYRNGHFEAGPLLNYRFGRGENRNKALRGLGDIGNTLEFGGYAQYRSKSMLLSADIRQALGAGQGRTLRLTAGHGVYHKGPWVVAVAARAKILSKKGMQTNFGVSEAQAQSSEYGFEAYEASGGFSEVSANIVAGYKLTDRARIVTLLSVGQLLNGAKNSPIVKSGVGSRTQMILGTALTVNF